VTTERIGAQLRALLLACVLGCPITAAAQADAPSADAPDRPQAFGPRTSWFTVRGRDPATVARALGLSGLTPASWASGLAAATARPGPAPAEATVFLSPPVDGWIFVVSSSLPYPDHRPARSDAEAEIDRRFDHVFTALAVRFPDVQFFGSYRVVGFSAWARARGARIERIFAYAGGEVLANVGEQTGEERALRFPDIGGMTIEAAREALNTRLAQRERREEQLLADGLDRAAVEQALRDEGRAPIPGEDDTLALAGAWSINPATLEARDLAPASGYTALLPPDLRQ
jgi:hypothetical protein